MGLPDPDYLCHIPRGFLSCGDIPGYYRRATGADLARSTKCYCFDHDPAPCQARSSTITVCIKKYNSFAIELMVLATTHGKFLATHSSPWHAASRSVGIGSQISSSRH